jgi:hypothetical protein
VYLLQDLHRSAVVVTIRILSRFLRHPSIPVVDDYAPCQQATLQAGPAQTTYEPSDDSPVRLTKDILNSYRLTVGLLFFFKILIYQVHLAFSAYSPKLSPSTAGLVDDMVP